MKKKKKRKEKLFKLVLNLFFFFLGVSFFFTCCLVEFLSLVERVRLSLFNYTCSVELVRLNMLGELFAWSCLGSFGLNLLHCTFLGWKCNRRVILSRFWGLRGSPTVTCSTRTMPHNAAKQSCTTRNTRFMRNEWHVTVTQRSEPIA
eukprot:Rmarinus@m.26972